mmetsp:Transcript_10328/g.24842  ORF Transcript_10328/g.24842 Transcript_10328/m.24842 type:complete len:211 (-) Transcript_10328:1320-1952(-)
MACLRFLRASKKLCKALHGHVRLAVSGIAGRQSRVGHVELAQVLVKVLPCLDLLCHTRAVHFALQALLAQATLHLGAKALEPSVQAGFELLQLPLQGSDIAFCLAPVLADTVPAAFKPADTLTQTACQALQVCIDCSGLLLPVSGLLAQVLQHGFLALFPVQVAHRHLLADRSRDSGGLRFQHLVQNLHHGMTCCDLLVQTDLEELVAIL